MKPNLFVAFITADKQNGWVEVRYDNPIIGATSLRAVEGITARLLIQQNAITTTQLPIVVTSWKRFEQAE